MTNATAPATPEAKADLRLVITYVREHATPTIAERVAKALTVINAKVERHEVITESNVKATWVALKTAVGERSPLWRDALGHLAASIPQAPVRPLPVEVPAQPETPVTPEAPKPQISRAKFDNVPEGNYAFATEEGHVAFAQVVHKDYPSGTYAFANLLIGSPGDWTRQKLSREATVSVLTKIEADIEGAARLFGQKTEACGHCGSPLSNPQSRAAGYGRDCANKHGYWYPTLKEAKAILGEDKGEEVAS